MKAWNSNANFVCPTFRIKQPWKNISNPNTRTQKRSSKRQNWFAWTKETILNCSNVILTIVTRTSWKKTIYLFMLDRHIRKVPSNSAVNVGKNAGHLRRSRSTTQLFMRIPRKNVQFVRRKSRLLTTLYMSKPSTKVWKGLVNSVRIPYPTTI